MHTHKADIERPVSLAVLVAAVVACFAFTQLSLWRMDQAKAAAPTLIVHERAALIAALRDAPFSGAATEEGELLGDPVWLIGRIGCEGCDAATARALKALRRAGLEPRVLLAPESYPAPADAAVLVALVARTGDADHFLDWREGRPLPPIVTDPAEAEGYGELARQSASRLAAVLSANGLDAEPPVLIWRVDGAWRAAPAEPAAAVAQRDLQL